MKRNFPTWARQSLTIAGSCLALGLAPAVAVSAAEPMTTDRSSNWELAQRNSYPPETARLFMQNCTRAAQESRRLTQQQATQDCQCHLSELQARYTAQQMRQIFQRIRQTNGSEFPPEMVQVARICAQRVSGNR